MKGLLLAALTGVLAFGASPAMSAGKSAQMRRLDARYKDIQSLRRQLLAVNDLEDMRGRHPEDDARKWILSVATEERIATLRREAKVSDAQAANTAIAELELLLDENLSRAQFVNDYWFKTAPAPVWRRNWRAFAVANGLPPDPSEPKVLEIERRLMAQLATGDFELAVRATAPELNAAVRSMVGETRSALARERKSADLKFIPHQVPCISSEPRKDAPREFYPPGAKRRGEEGSVMLRTRVNADGCGLATAVVVSTGSPELDAAGLLTAEYSRFSPGMDNGVPIASEVTYLVKFVIKD